MVLRKLAISNFATRKIRFALTVAAIALSVSLVVSVTSGYASMESAVLKFMSTTQGETDVFLSHDTARNGVPLTVVERLQKDPQVENLRPRLEGNSIVLNDKKKTVGFGQMEINGIVRAPDNVTMELGEWFKDGDGDVAVIDQVAARALAGIQPGDETQPTAALGADIYLPGVTKTLKLKVVGVMRKPAFLASLTQTVYVPLKVLQDFTGEQTVSRVEIDLHPGVDSGAFAARWAKELSVTDPLLNLRTQAQKRKEFDQNLQGVRIMSYLGGMVSMLAATFIVFSTLAMGVTERQRTLAMLRAIGAQKSQLAKLVILEGLVICGMGVLIGLPLGFGWLGILLLKFGDIFQGGLTISWSGVIFAVVVSMLAALVASLLPAYSAMKSSPLEAMSPLATPTTTRPPIFTAMFGIFFASLDSLAMFGNWSSWLGALGVNDPAAAGRAVTFYGHFTFGIPGMMLGFFLLSPMFVWLVERIAGPIVAMMLGIKFALLRQQLSSGIWRAAGTCSALMVGLSILVVMQTQGRTMLGGWQLPTKFPDVFITTGMNGLKEKDQAQLKQVEGIEEIMPIAIATPGFGTGYLAIAAAAVVPDSTMFFGIDPDLAFKMMQLDFREGTPEEAARMLKLGRHVVITEEFRQLKKLRVGDTVPLQTKTGKKDFTVAGIVWSPGIDVMVGMFDLNKQFEKRTAFSMFGSLEDAAKDFDANDVTLFAANLKIGVEKKELINRIREKIGPWNLNIGDVRQIKHRIIEIFNKLLLLASTVAFAAMAVSSLGVTNTIMASIRSRRWQFGVLRAIGVTRSALARLILAEGILLGAIGCALGLSAGLIMSINAKRLAVVVLGYDPPMVIPWAIIGIGTAIVFGVTLIASILPARNVANTEVLELLQAGRASA